MKNGADACVRQRGHAQPSQLGVPAKPKKLTLLLLRHYSILRDCHSRHAVYPITEAASCLPRVLASYQTRSLLP